MPFKKNSKKKCIYRTGKASVAIFMLMVIFWVLSLSAACAILNTVWSSVSVAHHVYGVPNIKDSGWTFTFRTPYALPHLSILCISFSLFSHAQTVTTCLLQGEKLKCLGVKSYLYRKHMQSAHVCWIFHSLMSKTHMQTSNSLRSNGWRYGGFHPQVWTGSYNIHEKAISTNTDLYVHKEVNSLYDECSCPTRWTVFQSPWRGEDNLSLKCIHMLSDQAPNSSDHMLRS